MYKDVKVSSKICEGDRLGSRKPPFFPLPKEQCWRRMSEW